MRIVRGGGFMSSSSDTSVSANGCIPSESRRKTSAHVERLGERGESISIRSSRSRRRRSMSKAASVSTAEPSNAAIGRRTS